MYVSKYDKQFLGLVSFASGTNFLEEDKAIMFEDNINPRYNDLVIVQRFRTLRDVVDAYSNTEKDKLEA